MNDRSKEWFNKYVGSAPYPYQESVIDSNSSRIIINKSRQVGMTTALGFKCILKALHGGVALIASPSQRQSYRVMSMVESFIRETPLEKALREDSNTIKGFDNGGRIHSLPNSASQIRGYKADLVVLDEFAHFLNGTDIEVYEAIQPSAARGGQLILSSSPFGEKNVFAERWKDPAYEKITVNWLECPDLAPRIQQVRAGYDDVSFDQEFNNVFRGEVETEFPIRLLETCIDQEMQYEMNAYGDIAAADIGRRRDLTSVATVRKTTSGTFSVIEKQTWAGVPFEEQQIRFLEIAKRVGQFRIDQGGMGEAPSEWLSSRSENIRPIFFTNEIKTDMFLNLKRLYEQRRIRHPFDPILMKSLSSVRRYYRLGRVIIDAERTDETGHADEATALAMACWDMTKEVSDDVMAGIGEAWG